MSCLTTLTPAENLLLRDGRKVSVRLMLKGTLMDLLMRGVLAYQEMEVRPSRLDRPRRYKYIVAGKHMDSYEAQRHEEVFLGAYRYGGAGRYQLRNLVSVALERTGGRRDFCRSVRLSQRLLPLYSPVLENVLAAGILNSTGRLARKTLIAEIELTEATILGALGDDPPRAVRMINDLGGNVVLLKRLPEEALGDLRDDLFEDRRQRVRGESGCGGGGCSGSGCGGWDHGSFNDGFDNAADAAGCGGAGCGSDGGSGCGGSGCSGCSGCGGCGGD
ncbi:MAG: hypothetical protein JNM62_04395 [Flavobacteriales bacterium]|nr:hypothetical protein [Flavobacteriales bacterium]